MKEFKAYFIVPEEPEIVYKALTNPVVIKLWTGYEAEMSEEVGAEFSMWDGDICGINLGFEKNKLIQQQWFFGDQEEASIVSIKLHKHKKGCSAELLHTNIPDQDYEAIVAGWREAYFGELIDFYTGE
ncbi:MAG: SRPBCC domain-containing protein [Chitinophagales bacterium]